MKLKKGVGTVLHDNLASFAYILYSHFLYQYVNFNLWNRADIVVMH